MSIRLLDLTTCTCVVSAPDPIHEKMLPYVHPYLIAALDQPDIVVTIGCDATDVDQTARALAAWTPTATRASHPQGRYHAWVTEDREILLPLHSPDHLIITTNGSHIFLTAAHPRVAATIGTRIIRQLIMRGGEAAGGQYLHAGAVDFDGDGVLIGGHPGAGKTSVLTHLIEHFGARPVANDRTVLAPVDRGWRAIGVPLAWRFTPESIGSSPALSAALADHEPTRGRLLVDGKMELTPSEVSLAFERPTLPATRLTQVIILRRSTDGPPHKPDAWFARQHLDFGTADIFSEDWLGIRRHLAGHRDQSPTSGACWWHDLTGTVPIRVVSWTDPAELPSVAAAVVHGAPL